MRADRIKHKLTAEFTLSERQVDVRVDVRKIAHLSGSVADWQQARRRDVADVLSRAKI